MKSSASIHHFKDQNYSIFFNSLTGFFARVEDAGYAELFWSFHGPEILDVSITNWCDKGCAVCYRESGQSGHHMSLHNYEIVLRQADLMHVLQVALGGGNPNQHPDFCNILRITRDKYGIVPNFTTNGRGLSKNILEATKRYCGAIAVSAYEPYTETRTAISLLHSFKIKTNVHFILNAHSVNTALEWLNDPPDFLEGINALIFLNYKPVGRHPLETALLKDSSALEQFVRLATTKKHRFRIGFDNCMVSALTRFSDVPSICYESCDAARFSMYISEDMRAYHCSFLAKSRYEGIKISQDNMLEIWRCGKSFVEIRSTLASCDCHCEVADLCRGGCPCYREINFCPDQVAQ
ncbi:MAG: radical SAM protein [Dehalococcoidia bacterium]